MLKHLPTLYQTRAALGEQLKALDAEAGDQNLNRQQTGRWNKLTRELAEVDVAIAETQAAQARLDAVTAMHFKYGGDAYVNGSSTSTPWDGLNVRTESPSGLVSRAHQALDRADDLSHDGREMIARAIDGSNGSGVAALTLARGSEAYLSGFLKVLQAPETGHAALTPDEARAFADVAHCRATITTGAGTGGYTIPLSLDPTLAAIVNDGVANPFRANATRRIAVSSPHRLVTSAGATASWTDEGAAWGDGSPAFAAKDVDLFKQTIMVKATYEVLEDGGKTIRESLPLLLADARDRLENVAFTLGSGSGAPFGIITRLAATSGSTVTCTTRGTFTSASSGDVMAMLAALPPRARQSKAAAWLAPVQIVNTIRTQTLGTDTTAMLTDLSAGNVPQLLGLPVYEASGMSSATTSGSRPLAVVDLSAYSIVEHAAGATLQYVPATVDGDGAFTGTAAWLYHARLGADMTDPNQGRLLLA